MIYRLWISLFLFSLFCSSLSKTDTTQGKCSYYLHPHADDLEIQCPTDDDDSDLVIHITKESISIDCTYTQKTFHAYQLPGPNTTNKKYTIPNYIKKFQIRFCPWPQEPFHTVIERFSLGNLAYLEFVTSYSNIIVLTADYFQNLNNLQHLNLNENGITDVDEEVFKNTPNLVELELQDNNITLKKNLFQNVPLLEFLDLSGNGLDNLPPDIFKPLKKLQRLHLWKNKLKNLNSSIFKGLVSLKSLELSINKIETIAEDTFKGLANLRRVNLSANKIKKVSPNLFRYNSNLKMLKMKNNFELDLPDYFLANSTLTNVDLTNCCLKSIPDHIFKNSTNLKIVKLQKNYLQYLPEALFKGLANLKQIRLQDNHIESFSLTSEVFSDLIALERVNLKANKLEYVDSKIFNNKTKLKVVNLSHNQIVTPVDEIITLDDKQSLMELDLSHNNISSIKLRYLKPLVDINIRLNYNQINIVDFQDVNFNATSAISRLILKYNPIDCCYNYDLVEFMKRKRNRNFEIVPQTLKCSSPHELKDTDVINVARNLTCPLEHFSKNYFCPEECSCKWKSAMKLVTIDCSYRKLIQFPKINFTQNEQIEINLIGNFLSVVPELKNYDSIRNLFLSHNRIREILWLPPKLEVLELDHNLISTLNPIIVSKMNSTFLMKLTLHNNPWICDCDSESLADFLRQSSKVVVKNDIICINKNNQSLLDLKKPDLCDTWKTIYLLVLVLSLLLAFTACAALYYRFQQQIKIWLFSRNLCLWWVTEEDLDKDKTYDAFISYSHKDEEFVIENLLPTLETSPQTYKLCLHYRNWIPGELITNQIHNSVLRSKRTLVVLSKNFLESVWGKMEFRTAHTHAMSDGRTKVIIVLYGDIDVSSLDEELKMYLKTNTYVKWGDPYFWNKLKYALPHRKVVNSGRQRFANMLRVSEESTLIQSATPSPGTTPPASLNPSLAEINPFKFVHKLDGSKCSVPV